METPRNPDSVDFGLGTNDRRYTYWRQSSFHQQSQEPKTPISIITNDTTKPLLSRTVSSIDMPPEIDYSFDYQNDSIFEDPKKKPLDLDSVLSISVLCSISLSRIYLSGFHSFLCLCVFVCVIAMQTHLPLLPSAPRHPFLQTPSRPNTPRPPQRISLLLHLHSPRSLSSVGSCRGEKREVADEKMIEDERMRVVDFQR